MPPLQTLKRAKLVGWRKYRRIQKTLPSMIHLGLANLDINQRYAVPGKNTLSIHISLAKYYTNFAHDLGSSFCRRLWGSFDAM
jgi:hypothetical protein